MTPAAQLGPAACHTGFSCNNRCLFCAGGSLRLSEPATSDAAVRRQLEHARAADKTEVALVGGEPTLREELPDWASEAKLLGFDRVVLQTNGRRLSYPGYTEMLAQRGIDRLEISLHGPRAEIHDHHTRVPGSFSQTVTGLAAGCKAGLAPCVTMVVTRSNFRHLEEMVAFTVRQEVLALHLAVTRSFGEGRRLLPRLVPRLALLRPLLAAAVVRAHALGLELQVSGVPPCLLPDPAVLLSEPAQPGGQRVFASVCVPCGMRSECTGLDRLYADRYGLAEITGPLDAPPPGSAVSPAAEPQRQLFVGIGRVEPPLDAGHLPLLDSSSAGCRSHG